MTRRVYPESRDALITMIEARAAECRALRAQSHAGTDVVSRLYAVANAVERSILDGLLVRAGIPKPKTAVRNKRTAHAE